MIDEQNGNCTVTSIPLVSFDAVAVDESHVRLRHMSELLEADDATFIFSGQVIQSASSEVFLVMFGWPRRNHLQTRKSTPL